MIVRIITYLLVLLPAVSWSQELRSSVSEKTILIGQPTVITLTIEAETQDSIFFRQKQSTLEARSKSSSGSLSNEGAEFEIIASFNDTTIFHSNGKTWKGEYIVTTWDSGHFIIPGQDVLINDSTFTFKELQIRGLLVDAIEDIDLYDIRENYAEIPPKPFSFSDFLKNNWWWLIIILLIAVISAIVLRRKQIAREEEALANAPRPMTLKERTIMAIEALEDERLWEQDKLKKHFVELSYILRSYLTSRYSISLLEKTTYETKILLTKKGLNEDTVTVIGKLLSQADMVKFAKSKPDELAILRQSTLAKQIIAETSPLDFDNVD
ncbi:MAG: hypothetical protein MK066_06280 [Crocinitomicaceae bacterium]|nr:hypothetical protein [Crocinitomicaceae bacterium]